MSTDTMPQTARVPRYVRLPGPIIRGLLARGLPFGPNVLLTVQGRKSGRQYTVPVALVDHAARRYVQSPFGAVAWVLNLRTDGRAIISKGRTREDVVAVELTPEDAGPVLRAVLTPYLRPRLLGWPMRRYLRIRHDADDAAFVSRARHHPIFELRPLTG